MYPTRTATGDRSPVTSDNIGILASAVKSPREDLLVGIDKAMVDADQTLGDLFQMVSVLSDRLVGGLPVPAENHEGDPPPPGALNLMLWRAEVQGRHLSVLRERLSFLLQML